MKEEPCAKITCAEWIMEKSHVKPSESCIKITCDIINGSCVKKMGKDGPYVQSTALKESWILKKKYLKIN